MNQLEFCFVAFFTYSVCFAAFKVFDRLRYWYVHVLLQKIEAFGQAIYCHSV